MGHNIVSKLVYNLLTGPRTYLYRGYIKYHGHPSMYVYIYIDLCIVYRFRDSSSFIDLLSF